MKGRRTDKGAHLCHIRYDSVWQIGQDLSVLCNYWCQDYFMFVWTGYNIVWWRASNRWSFIISNDAIKKICNGALCIIAWGTTLHPVLYKQKLIYDMIWGEERKKKPRKKIPRCKTCKDMDLYWTLSCKFFFHYLVKDIWRTCALCIQDNQTGHLFLK